MAHTARLTRSGDDVLRNCVAGSRRLGSISAMAPISPHAAAATAAKKRSAPILALSVEQACEALGVSLMPGNESEAAGLLDAYMAAQQGQAAMA
jgi:hypothetical protein